jgi:hypothetical protein
MIIQKVLKPRERIGGTKMANEVNSKQKERVQFDFSTKDLKRLDDIKEKTDAVTKAEIVRKALKLYDWFVNEVDPDSTLKIFDKRSEPDDEPTTVVKVKLLI